MEDRVPTLQHLTLGFVQVPGEAPRELAPGDRIGPFQLLQLLGRGGMGQVFLAEQLEPVQRQLALKFMHSRLAAGEAQARFMIERQALARMSHPAIAQVFEAGTTADGFPYLAMEFVAGQSITRYSEQHGLDLAARLRLFQRVCLGVAHAHQKGLVHRDLKPRNILVTTVDGEAQPKIIDFGIATASFRPSGQLKPGGRLLGTPGYMSPEQAQAADDVDTRSDVYALGAVLYELLTGMPALPRALLADCGADSERLRAVLSNHQLIPPSSRTPAPEDRMIARLPEAVRRQRARALRGDLDAIITRALQRDRNQRYQSALELHDELGRVLARRPVRAMPDSRPYRLRKLVQRHRLALSAGALVLVLLVLGLGAATYGLLEARAQRTLAEQRQQTLGQLVRFQQSMLAQIDIDALGASLSDTLNTRYQQALALPPMAGWQPPNLMAAEFAAALDSASPADAGRQLLQSQVLDPASAVIARDFADAPLLAAEIEASLVPIQLALGLGQEALMATERVLAHRRKHLGDRHPQTLDTRLNRLQQLLGTGHAASHLSEAESLQVTTRQVLGADAPDSVRAQRLLALLLNEIGNQSERALALIVEVEQRSAAVFGNDDPATVQARIDHGQLLARAGQLEAAVTVFAALVEDLRQRLGAEHTQTLAVTEQLAVALASSGQAEDALTLQQQTFEVRRRLLGATHPLTVGSMSNLASTYTRLGALEDSLKLGREALRLRTLQLQPDHPLRLRTMLNLAASLTRLADRNWLEHGDLRRARAEGFDEAATLYEEVLQRRLRVLGAEHPDTLNAIVNLGDNYTRAERYAEALPLYVQLDQTRTRVLSEAHPATLEARMFHGRALQKLGRCDQAVAPLEQALSGHVRLGKYPEQVQISSWALVQCLDLLKRREQATSLLRTHLQRLLQAEPVGPGQPGKHIQRELQAWLKSRTWAESARH